MTTFSDPISHHRRPPKADLFLLGPSEDAQKHRTAMPTNILVITAASYTTCHMLLVTLDVINSTFAAASAMRMSGRRVGEHHAFQCSICSWLLFAQSCW